MTATTLTQAVENSAETALIDTKATEKQATTKLNGHKHSHANGNPVTQNEILSQLYANNGVLKIWKTATEHLEREVCLLVLNQLM